MQITIEENPEKLEEYKHIKPAKTFGPLRCFEKFPSKKYSCTLSKGHDGPHVAHFFKKVVAVWD